MSTGILVHMLSSFTRVPSDEEYLTSDVMGVAITHHVLNPEPLANSGVDLHETA